MSGRAAPTGVDDAGMLISLNRFSAFLCVKDGKPASGVGVNGGLSVSEISFAVQGRGEERFVNASPRNH
jgi:hypothetical protein